MNIKFHWYVIPVVLAGIFLLWFYWDFPLKQESNSVKIILGGDIYIGNRLDSQLRQKSPSYFTKYVEPITKNSDLHLANLEAPITTHEEKFTNKKYTFKTNPRIALRMLNELSIDGVSLANNHIMDYGKKGLLDTFYYLNKANIKHAGAGANQYWSEQAEIFERSGQKIAFLSFSNTFPEEFWASSDTAGVAYGDYDRVRKQVREIENQVDFTIASFHWGGEQTFIPRSYQKKLARISIDEGADVVFGHHPHTIQPVERYDGGIIFYSLGNYFFNTLSEDVQYGLLAEINLKEDKKIDTNYHLLNVNNYQVKYRPRVQESFQDINHLSNYLNQAGYSQIAKSPPDQVSIED